VQLQGRRAGVSPGAAEGKEKARHKAAGPVCEEWGWLVFPSAKPIRIKKARDDQKADLLARIHSLAASTTIRDELFVARLLADATRWLGGGED
jgi:hypothetical protein